MSVKNQYVKELFKEFGYIASWLPSANIQLGDVGYLEKNEFIKITTLANKGVNMQSSAKGSIYSLEYVSNSGVEVITKMLGDIPAGNSTLLKNEAGITINFNSAKSTYFKSDDVHTRRMENLYQLEKDLLLLYSNQKWDKKWIVISEVAESKSTTVIIGKDKGSKIDLKANSKIGVRELVTTNIDAKFEVGYQKGIALKMISKTESTPLFKAVKIKDGVVSSPKLHPSGIKYIDLRMKNTYDVLDSLELVGPEL